MTPENLGDLVQKVAMGFGKLDKKDSSIRAKPGHDGITSTYTFEYVPRWVMQYVVEDSVVDNSLIERLERRTIKLGGYVEYSSTKLTARLGQTPELTNLIYPKDAIYGRTLEFLGQIIDAENKDIVNANNVFKIIMGYNFNSDIGVLANPSILDLGNERVFSRALGVMIRFAASKPEYAQEVLHLQKYALYPKINSSLNKDLTSMVTHLHRDLSANKI